MLDADIDLRVATMLSLARCSAAVAGFSFFVGSCSAVRAIVGFAVSLLGLPPPPPRGASLRLLGICAVAWLSAMLLW